MVAFKMCFTCQHASACATFQFSSRPMSLHPLPWSQSSVQNWSKLFILFFFDLGHYFRFIFIYFDICWSMLILNYFDLFWFILGYFGMFHSFSTFRTHGITWPLCLLIFSLLPSTDSFSFHSFSLISIFSLLPFFTCLFCVSSPLSLSTCPYCCKSLTSHLPSIIEAANMSQMITKYHKWSQMTLRIMMTKVWHSSWHADAWRSWLANLDSNLIFVFLYQSGSESW